MWTCRGKNMESGFSRTLLGFFRLGWMQYQNFVRKIIKMLIIIWVQLKIFFLLGVVLQLHWDRCHILTHCSCLVFVTTFSTFSTFPWLWVGMWKNEEHCMLNVLNMVEAQGWDAIRKLEKHKPVAASNPPWKTKPKWNPLQTLPSWICFSGTIKPYTQNPLFGSLVLE